MTKFENIYKIIIIYDGSQYIAICVHYHKLLFVFIIIIHMNVTSMFYYILDFFLV